MAQKDNPFAGWGIGHLELIARYGQPKQRELLEAMLDDSYLYDDISVENLKRNLASEMQVLATAAWGMDDILMNGTAQMQACKDCPARTGFKPMLFADAGKKDKGDRCLDSTCWATKAAAVKHQAIIKARDKQPALVLVGDLHRVDDAEKKLGEIRNRFAYIPAKKSEADAVPVIDIHADDKAGAVKWMKLRDEGKTVASSGGKPTRTMADKQKELNSKRWNSILKVLRKRLADTTLERITPADKVTAVVVLVAEFSTRSVGHGALSVGPDEALKMPNFSTTEHFGETLGQVWDMVREKIDDAITYNGPITQVSDDKIEHGKFVAWLIGADLAELEKAAAEEFPVPRSWGKQATATVVSGESMTRKNNPVDEDGSDDEES
jgi:hypothetical protein